jgi:hypothetical protein
MSAISPEEAVSHSARLVGKLLSNSPESGFEPLRVTLKLDNQEYEEGIFSWRGFLYYKWVLSDLYAQISLVLQEIGDIVPRGPSSAEASSYIPDAKLRRRSKLGKRGGGVRDLGCVFIECRLRLERINGVVDRVKVVNRHQRRGDGRLFVVSEGFSVSLVEYDLANTAARVLEVCFEGFDSGLSVRAIDGHGCRECAAGRCRDSTHDSDDGDPPDDDKPGSARGELSEAVEELGHGKPFANHCTSSQIIALVQKSVKSG